MTMYRNKPKLGRFYHVPTLEEFAQASYVDAAAGDRKYLEGYRAAMRDADIFDNDQAFEYETARTQGILMQGIDARRMDE